MPDLDDADLPVLLRNGVDDTISPLADPIVRGAPGEPLRAMRSRIIGEGADSIDQAQSIALVADGFEFPGGGFLDEDPISCHAA